MEIKTPGIILKRVSRDEQGVISSVFTEAYGKLRVTSKGTEKAKSRLRASLEVFSVSDFHLVKASENSPFYRLAGARCLTQNQELRDSLPKIASACVMAELTELFMQPEDSSPETYRLLCDSLAELCACGESGVKAVENSFKVRLLKIAGYDISAEGALSDYNFISREEYSAIESVSAGETGEAYGTVSREKTGEIIDAYITGVLGDSVNSIKFRAGLK